MKLKQYLKGLGLGIIVTAVILGISSRGRSSEVSDDAVVQRAKELGMIENTVLSETQKNGTTEASMSTDTMAEEAADTEDPDTMAQEYTGTEYPDTMAQEYTGTEHPDTMAQEASGMDGAVTLAEETTVAEAGDTIAQEEADSEEQERKDPEPVIIEPTPGQSVETGVFIIHIGETPYSISRRLYEGGWVSSTEEFKKHLVNNGYDTRIIAAAYHIPAGANMDQIAQMITQYRTVQNQQPTPDPAAAQ